MSTVRPLRVGVSELLAHPGTRRRFDDQVEIDGLAISSAAVAPGTPVDIGLVLESIGGPVTATGTIGVALGGRLPAVPGTGGGIRRGRGP